MRPKTQNTQSLIEFNSSSFNAVYPTQILMLFHQKITHLFNPNTNKIVNFVLQIHNYD